MSQIKVFVYFNLHKKVWSVKALEGPNKGRVIAHRDRVVLVGCTYKVSQAGRQRVLKEQRKNVHAGVVGYWQQDMVDQSLDIVEAVALKDYTPVTYNPYKYDSFVNKNNENPVSSSLGAYLAHKKVYAYKPS